MTKTQNNELEGAEMKAPEEQAVKTEAPAQESPSISMRQRLRDRMKQEYPEDNYETDEDGEILGGRLMDRLDRNDAQLNRYREQDEKMKKMFVDNPATARFFTRWGAGDDPVSLIAEIFGDKLKETVESPDAENLLKNGMQKYFDNAKKAQEANDEFTKNAEASLELIKKREGDNPEIIDKVFDSVLQIAADAIVGKISAETLDMVTNGINYDQSVSNAREEGLAAGRNEKYQERLRQRGRGDGQPAAASGSAQTSNPDRQMRRESEMSPRSAWGSPETRTDW